jgi:hypothetical protein
MAEEEKKKDQVLPAAPALPPTASEISELTGRVQDLEKAMEELAPRLVKVEKFMQLAAEQAAKLLPADARKGFLSEILG